MNSDRSLAIFGLLVSSLILLSGCWGEQKKSGLVVINVLDKEFYDDCHIKGSINIPLEDVQKQIGTIDKNAEVVFYCSNYQCTGSEYAALKLRKEGFGNVSVYEGGMAEWYQAGLPIEGPHKQAYLSKPSRQIMHDEESEIPLIAMEKLAKKMDVWPKKDVAA